MTAPAPLAGVRIVDLSRILAGPFATQLLADLGATVVKFEPPSGDPTRQWGPPFDDHGSAYYRCANRGKECRVVDLGSESGRAEIDRELADADVVVENFRPGSASAVDFTPERLRERFDRLIVASVRAFASDVTGAARPGYDFLLQAESGWMAFTGEPDGRPMKVGVALVDVLAALYLANGIQAALRHRDQTGVALHVEVPLMEAALAATVNVGAGVLMTGDAPTRHGVAHPNIVPYQSFPCRDGDVAIAVGNDRQFESLMLGLGLQDSLAEHPNWRTNPGRVDDRFRLVSLLSDSFATRTLAEALALGEASGVACGPVRQLDDVLLHQRGTLHDAVETMTTSEGTPVEVLRSPVLLDGERACHPRPPSRDPTLEPPDPV